MHPFFAPLSERESMLLLTALTIGGSHETELFSLLPAPSGQRLQDKAQQLLQISADKRVPFMVREMKRALKADTSHGLELIDPSWLAHELKETLPSLVACILLTLPQPTVRSILKRLPESTREALPPKSNVRQTPEEVRKTLRQLFEQRFTPMPGPMGKELTFPALIHLQRKELLTLTHSLGLLEAGQAFVAVGPMALRELCRRLPHEQTEELIQATREAAQTDPSELRSAQRFLARVSSSFDDSSEFLYKAGLWRLAKSSLPESPQLRTQLSQRLPREPGLIFLEYVEKMANKHDLTEKVLLRFQDSVLLKVRELSEKGLLSKSWADLPARLHGTTTEHENDPTPADDFLNDPGEEEP